jgi:SPW repeat
VDELELLAAEWSSFISVSPAPGGRRAGVSGTEDTMNELTNAKLCDLGNLILGIVLFFTPWIFSYPAGLETQNAMISGVVIAVLSIAALAAFTVWEEWLNLVVGLWLIASPWILKFQGTKAMRVDVAIGIVVAVLALIELWVRSQAPPTQVANR